MVLISKIIKNLDDLFCKVINRNGKKKILFHGHSMMNYYMFEPISQKITQDTNTEVYFCFSEIEGQSEDGKSLGDKLNIPKNRQITVKQARFKKWSAVFDADYYTPCFYRNTVLVQIFHGIAAKSVYLLDGLGNRKLMDYRYHPSMKRYDLLLFPNELFCRKAKDLGLWKTDKAGAIAGMCCLDKMVKDNCNSTISILRDKYIPAEHKNKRVILYAPTFGDFNSLSRVGIKILEALASMDVFIIVKPHPLCLKYKIKGTSDSLDVLLRKKFVNNNFVLVMSKPYEVMLISDAIISDFSSITFEYALLRKPIFLFIGNDLKIHVADQEQFSMLCDCCYVVKEDQLINRATFENNVATKQQIKSMELLEKTYLANVGHATDVVVDILRKNNLIT